MIYNHLHYFVYFIKMINYFNRPTCFILFNTGILYSFEGKRRESR